MTLQEVFEKNRVRQNRARALNVRVGREAFTVFTAAQIAEALATALPNARRMRDIPYPEDFLLPALDAQEETRVLVECPDKVLVLGEELGVEYADGYGRSRTTPRVTLSSEAVKAHSWNRLPDEGVKLPGGRAMEVVVGLGYYGATIAGSDIPQLKSKVREHLNRGQWECWRRPAMQVPDPAAEDSVVPFVIACYGKCVVTGEELKAYGTAVVNTNRWYASDPWLTAQWFRDLAEAQNAADATAQKLVELRAEAKTAKTREIELVAVNTEANAAYAELRTLQSSHSGNDWYALGYELRRQREEAVRLALAVEAELAAKRKKEEAEAAHRRNKKLSAGEVSDGLSALRAKFGK